MSSLTNPYAVSILGKPLAPAPVPQLRAEGAPMSRAQLDMARWAFGRFMDQARLSFAPNPSQHGFLPDGSRFRIMSVSGAQIMQVWPVQITEGRRTVTVHGILLEMDDGSFATVRFSRDVGWEVSRVTSGRCGATVHTNGRSIGNPGGIFALTNYGAYKDSVQVNTEFTKGRGSSTPHKCGHGTFFIGDATLEFSGDGVLLFLPGAAVFARIADENSLQISFDLVSIHSSVDNDRGEKEEITLPETLENVFRFRDSPEDKVYGYLSKSSVRGEVIVRTASDGVQWIPSGSMATNFYEEAMRFIHKIPKHRLEIAPRLRDMEVTVRVFADKGELSLSGDVRDLTQQPRLVTGINTLIRGESNLLYGTNAYSRPMGIDREDVYHDGVPCIGVVAIDNSDTRKDLYYTVTVPEKSVRTSYAANEYKLSHKSNTHLISYYDLRGNMKSIEMSTEININSISKTSSAFTSRSRFLSGDLYTEQRDVERLIDFSRSGEALYKGIISVGGYSYNAANISVKYEPLYEYITTTDVADRLITTAQSTGEVQLTMEASIFVPIAFDEMSGVLAGIRMEVTTGELIVQSRDEIGYTYFVADVEMNLFFTVLANGREVYRTQLPAVIANIPMKIDNAFPSITNIVPPLGSPGVTGWKENHQYEINSYRVDYEITGSAVCPTNKAIVTPTVSYMTGDTISTSHDRQFVTEGSSSEISFVFDTADATHAFVNFAKIDEYLPTKTMLAVDPLSGGCAVTNEVCKILVSPDGNVSDISDILGVNGGSIKEWCAST